MQSRCLFTNNNYIYISVFCKQLMVRRYIVSNKNLPDSDPDLTSSSLVTFAPKFDCILLHIQNFTRRRMLNVK
jgi:hypothetical protein